MLTYIQIIDYSKNFKKFFEIVKIFHLVNYEFSYEHSKTRLDIFWKSMNYSQTIKIIFKPKIILSNNKEMKIDGSLMRSVQYEGFKTCEIISWEYKESSLIIYAIGWAELEMSMIEWPNSILTEIVSSNKEVQGNIEEGKKVLPSPKARKRKKFILK